MTEPNEGRQKAEEADSINVRLPLTVIGSLKELAVADYRSLRDYCKVVLIQHVEASRSNEKAAEDPAPVSAREESA